MSTQTKVVVSIKYWNFILEDGHHQQGFFFLRFNIKLKQLLRLNFLVAQAELHKPLAQRRLQLQKHRKTSQEELISSNIKQKSGE